MTRDAVLKLLNEMRKAHRYWIPDAETREFLDDVDFHVRIGKAKELSPEESGRLQEIYRTFKREVK